ncbi:MAG TPA: HNH endonuclease, partial [Bacteroidales bacterium]|nr:HNH endonuclease [Bacteroidales bacterium]
FARYILLKLDYFYQNHQHRMHFETLSVEHILPQTPKDDSQWVVDFTETQREIMTHKFGNLVLITRRKNSSQGRLDYKDKKERYFQKNIDTCPNSIRILNKYNYWTPIEFDKNQTEVLDLVKTKYAIT